MSQKLTNFLSQLENSGPAGFEGLVATLLEKLTGQHFHLASSGTQEGRDMSSRRANANVIAVECKHYKRQTSLDEREILGEIQQAVRSISDLDIWVLVTSRDVPSQRYESFLQAANEQGIQFEVISEGDGDPSSLEVLCSQAPNVVLEYLQSITPVEQQELQEVLEDISGNPLFSENLEKLRQGFLQSLIGYDNWQTRQKGWLRTCFQTPQDSRADLSQILNVADEGAKLIVRHQAWEQIDNWYSTWKTTHKAFVLLGEEGDGKTWAVASWVNKKITEDERLPFVIFL
ncbi:MAG TPA: restriction endonuclease, partial [Acidobacteriota bacterium]|nr:restriction endonuclease [Acidobacteriota bacterium]